MTIRIEPSPRWVRAALGDVVVADTRAALLFWEDGSPVPFYAIPRDDVATEYLTPASEGTDHPFFGPRGATTMMFDLGTPAGHAARAAWVLAHEQLADHIVLTWEPGVLTWREEDVTVFAHPKDPGKRVDALPSSRHVVVEVAGQVLADTADPVLLFETGLPTRYYLPAADVRLDLLTRTDQTTLCPYKGRADGYWDLPGLPNVAWCYSDPDPAVAAIAGRIAFYNEIVDITVDGELQARPHTSFSRGPADD